MNFEKLRAFLETFPARGIPQAELTVLKDGKEVFHETVQDGGAAGGRPGKPGDLYFLYSCTKPVTCAAAMRLVEEGKIRLSDPVSRYIPAFAHVKVRDQRTGALRAPETPVTILHLFTMTAGMQYDLDAGPLLPFREDKTADTFKVVSAMADIPLSFDPGTHYQYSLCHDVLAAVVEVAGGRKYSDYLKEKLFDPLEMTDIGFRPDEKQREKLATLYTYHDEKGTATVRSQVNEYNDLSPIYESGGAGLFAGADAYNKFAAMLAGDGKGANGYRFLKPETVRRMQEDRLSDSARLDFVSRRFYGYGFGLCCRVHTHPFLSFSKSPVGEFGWDSAANAFSMFDPQNRVAAVYLTHVRSCSYGYYFLHPRLRNLIYEGLEG